MNRPPPPKGFQVLTAPVKIPDVLPDYTAYVTPKYVEAAMELE